MAFMLLNKQKSADYSCNQLIFSIFVISRTMPNQFEAKNNAKVGGAKKNRILAKNTHSVATHYDLLNPKVQEMYLQ